MWIENVFVHVFKGILSKDSVHRRLNIIQNDSLWKLYYQGFYFVFRVFMLILGCVVQIWTWFHELGFVQSIEFYIETNYNTYLQNVQDNTESIHNIHRGIFQNVNLVNTR